MYLYECTSVAFFVLRPVAFDRIGSWDEVYVEEKKKKHKADQELVPLVYSEDCKTWVSPSRNAPLPAFVVDWIKKHAQKQCREGTLWAPSRWMEEPYWPIPSFVPRVWINEVRDCGNWCGFWVGFSWMI